MEYDGVVRALAEWSREDPARQPLAAALHDALIEYECNLPMTPRRELFREFVGDVLTHLEKALMVAYDRHWKDHC